MEQDTGGRLAGILSEISQCKARIAELELQVKPLLKDVAAEFGLRVSIASTKTERPMTQPKGKPSVPAKITDYDRVVAAVKALGSGRVADVLAHLGQAGISIPNNSARTYLTRAARSGDLSRVDGEDGLFTAPDAKAKQPTLEDQVETDDE